MSMLDFRVLSYVAGLELTVDRLRKECSLLHFEADQMARRIEGMCGDDAALAPTEALGELQRSNRDFVALLEDFDDSNPDQPADYVAEIDFRPLVERIFRRQQRLSGLEQAQLYLDLACERIVWFPGRLQHVVENLISNAIKYYDPAKGQARIQVGLRRTAQGYEIRVSDNGLGLSRGAQARLFELFDRSAVPHLANPVVGVAVLKLLIEESGGSLSVESVEGQGAAFVAILPHYALTDRLC